MPEIENGRPGALKFDAEQDAVVKSWKISKEKGAIFIFPKKSELSPRYYLKEGGFINYLLLGKGFPFGQPLFYRN